MYPPVNFRICRHCGNLAGMIFSSGVPMICCGEPMAVLTANTTDAAKEKHVPVIEIQGDKVHVRVGSAPHPMEAAHYIEWIYLETENGGQRKRLSPGDKPEASFTLIDDKPIAAMAYCNLHGLWQKDI